MPNGFGIPNPDDPFGLPPLPQERQFPPFEWERPVWPALNYGPARLKILVMSDGNSYDMSAGGFSLGFAVTDIANTAHPEHPSYARFEFTLAHRSTDTGVTPGFANFRFTAGSLDDFHEVWLFGYTPGAPYLSANEIATIEAFMDNGGGVLAMGDHEDLGLGLCGGIKRVRSMRKWWFDSPAPPPNMIKAPGTGVSDRIDTVRQIAPSTQSDGNPQTIFPDYRYAYPYWHSWWKRRKFPHPILCGPRGAITVYPDHQHEGDCIFPNAAFANEYPGGVAVEIIAEGKNRLDNQDFGLLGVWDGHKPAANKGRVVVDATWHHWFNVNLNGLRNAGGDNYNDILAVFRNIAVWLAPKAQQAAMRRAGTRILLATQEFAELVPTLREFRPEKFYFIGAQARDVLGRLAPQCQSAAWFEVLVDREFIEEVRPFALNDRFEGLHNVIESAAIEAMATTVFGAAINAIAVEVNRRGFEKIASLDDELDEIAARGARIGAELARKQLRGSDRAMKLLAADGERKPKPR